ncbi:MULTISPECIES: hypothetical protein [Agrobacterium tumefaciens complex]|uniref:Uncharacterized protein n=1 Tax=Agrobacterium tomkonis CFBP 6623 TaxID=1183432 RepID=A0A1S7PEY6_9HYPH|nr:MULTISPECIES: hypothetical protein [Agrobacterium tumefaciens complex]QCL88737.1 hypothetical protein CFBP6623_06040 [Agrobacterium tumefaciens]CUX20268.1 conserved hypothetical protein [Agrobacterium tomkonis CFBP 6623]
MLGSGLGGFMDSFQKGMQLKEARADADRRKVLADREDAEYNRALEQRNAADTLAKGFQSDFDQKVKDGILSDADFDNAYQKGFVQPRIRQMQLNGDIQGATNFQKWADDKNTQSGSRAFMNSLRLFTMGDVDGGLDWLNKGAQIPGYFGEGYNFTKVSQGTNPYTGNPGVTIKIARPDGEPITQTFDIKDIPGFVAGNFSPDSASAWAKQQEEARKQASELKVYEQKKKIDRQYGLGQTKDRAAAITSLRKRLDGGLVGDETSFDDLPRPQQEKLIEQELELQQGQPGLMGQTTPAPAEKKVLVDTAIGKPVASGPKPAPADKPEAKPSGSDTKAKPAQTSERIRGLPDHFQGVRGRVEELKRLSEADAPGVGASSPSDASQQEALAQAETALEKGASIDEVAAGLQQAGVPEWQWPTAIQENLRERQRSYGLNP